MQHEATLACAQTKYRGCLFNPGTCHSLHTFSPPLLPRVRLPDPAFWTTCMSGHKLSTQYLQGLGAIGPTVASTSEAHKAGYYVGREAEQLWSTVHSLCHTPAHLTAGIR